jgi:hypothetical protein
MNKPPEEKRVYLKPEVRRVELSLSEVTLGSGCFAVVGDLEGPTTANCYPATVACRSV